MFGTCCSLRGNSTALFLISMGLGQLAIDLYASKGPSEAGEFAKALRSAVAKFREILEDARQRANAPTNGPLDECTIQIPDVGWSFPLEKAIGTLETAATWHEKVALTGFGVHAWF
ncbi:MAG: hypothetical protein U0441_23470 [Polyangiaceae bacterium]